jgi:hypothetical protein
MKLLSLTIITLLFVSCQTKIEDWQTLEFKAFKLKTPMGWSIIEAQGYDSYVGGLTNGRDTLSFDYGWYTAEIDESENERHLYAQDTVNGFTAVLKVPKTDGKGSIVMFIPKVVGSNRFGISGTDIKGTETILRIYKSIVFKQSDTTKNGLLLASKFKNYPFGSNQTLYRAKCASCHAFHKHMAAPAIRAIVNERSDVWIYQFLTNRKSLSVDSSQKVRVKEFGAHCIENPELTQKEVSEIVEYIKMN